jgi:hypothetical protein
MKSGVIWRCAACRSDRQAEGRRRRKERLVAEFGGACQQCGYDRCLAALDFHHRDRTAKEFGISKHSYRRWGAVVAEAGKCDLLCKNCHAEAEEELAVKRRSGS